MNIEALALGEKTEKYIIGWREKQYTVNGKHRTVSQDINHTLIFECTRNKFGELYLELVDIREEHELDDTKTTEHYRGTEGYLPTQYNVKDKLVLIHDNTTYKIHWKIAKDEVDGRMKWIIDDVTVK